MPITVKHKFVSAIPDAGDPNIVQPSNWNDTHELTGLGTMAEQNANAVAITGGTISGVTLPASNITGVLGVPNGGTGASTLTGYVKGTGTTPMTASATIPNTDITGLGTASTKDAGSPNGVATLDAGGKVPVSELPAAVLGALSYQGTWDASTNTPTLTSSVGTKGYYYVVSVAGNTNLNGITDWLVGDWAVYNGTVWQKVDNTEAVTSVNGQTGAVVLTASSVGAVPTTRTITAGTGLTGGGDLSADRTFAIDSTVVTLTGTQTLTNKTITSPIVNEILDANGNEVLGLLSTASATDYVAIKNGIGVGVPLHISSEGSSTNIGLHIQPKGTGLVTISDGTDFNKGIRFRSSGSAANAITLLDAVSTAGHVVTLPDATTTLVGRNTTDTLTNKSISGSTNTLSNIGNASLTNSAITINGTSTSLGGSINVGTVTSVDLTASTGISVSGGPITGSGSITVTNTAPDQTVVLTAGTGISTSGTYPNFTIANTAPSLGGDVVGPTGATDNAVARFDTTTGKLLQNSVVLVGDTGVVTGVTELTASTKVVSPHFDALNSAGGQLRNASGTAQLQWGGGGGNNISVDVAININPANAQVDLSPTGTGTVKINPATAGTMNNMVIGGTTPLAITGTTITANTQFTGAGTGLTGTAASLSIGGNAATVTNGVYTTGSYADPTWITSLAGSKITGTIDGGSF